MTWPPRMTDAEHEAAIERAPRRVIMSVRPNETRKHFAELRRLIEQRSPAQVKRMEKEKGIE